MQGPELNYLPFGIEHIAGCLFLWFLQVYLTRAAVACVVLESFRENSPPITCKIPPLIKSHATQFIPLLEQIY